MNVWTYIIVVIPLTKPDLNLNHSTKQFERYTPLLLLWLLSLALLYSRMMLLTLKYLQLYCSNYLHNICKDCNRFIQKLPKSQGRYSIAVKAHVPALTQCIMENIVSLYKHEIISIAICVTIGLAFPKRSDAVTWHLQAKEDYIQKCQYPLVR